MKRLVILGGGVLQIALSINETQHRWNAFAFLDYDENILNGKKCEAEIIGNDDSYQPQDEDELICAVGNSRIREKIITKLEEKGARFTSIIHPTAFIAKSASVGNGTIVYPYSQITADTSIGKGCIINMNCTIAHDVVIGNFCTISPGCNITGLCTLGSHVFMGVGSSIIPSICIGDEAFVCAGSTVMTKIKPGTKVMGCPARKIDFHI